MSREPTEIEMRVARALISTTGLSWDDLPASHPILIEEARAAIRAMREPTEAMLDAGAIVEVDTGWGGRGSYKPVGDAYRETRWKQMVDAASPPEE